MVDQQLAPTPKFYTNLFKDRSGFTHRLVHMAPPLVLASGSSIRRELLRKAKVEFTVQTAGVDEEAIKAALQVEGAKPREIADALAEAKTRRVANKRPDALVLGCDQVLEFEGDVLSKPASEDDAQQQLSRLMGKTHKLLSAAVIYENGQPVWRHVGQVRMTMRQASDTWLESYVLRNWPSIQEAVGSYKLEEEGVRLFTRVDGDFFNVLGMPLLEILAYLTLRGVIEG